MGGKLLTNYLKELLSYRQMNLMEETYVVNEMKETACYVSLDRQRDMAVARQHGPRNTISCLYVLPDYSTITKGYIKGRGATEPAAARAQQPGQPTAEQAVMLGNERFMVPEVLFTPSLAGVPQCGIAEAVVHAISATHAGTRARPAGGRVAARRAPAVDERVYTGRRRPARQTVR